MIYISLIISSFLSLYFISYLKNKWKFGIEDLTNSERKLHLTEVSRIGGIIFILPILILFFEINNTIFKQIFLFSLLILFLGLVEDKFQNTSPLIRIFFMIGIIIFFVLKNKFILIGFDIELLNYLNQFNYFSITFIIIGLVFFINGFNFIDGLNGLLLGISIIILATYCYYSYEISNLFYTILICILIPTIILFFFNFLYGKILSGDSGSYFLGFLIGCLSVMMSRFEILEESEIACIVFYPIIEVIFSALRRLIRKQSPFRPDGMHLHQILNRLIKNINYVKYKKRMTDFSNSLSSLIILITYSSLILIRNATSDFINPLSLFVIFCLVYLLSYFLLSRIDSKN